MKNEMKNVQVPPQPLNESQGSTGPTVSERSQRIICTGIENFVFHRRSTEKKVNSANNRSLCSIASHQQLTKRKPRGFYQSKTYLFLTVCLKWFIYKLLAGSLSAPFTFIVHKIQQRTSKKGTRCRDLTQATW